jgi:phytoene desaturase
VFRRGDFVFDGGPTVITAPHCLEELFALGGRRMQDYVELLPVDPFYRLLWPDGTRFDYSGDADRMAAEIERHCPEDVAGYQRFVDYSRQVFEIGYEQLAARPFLHFADMVRVAPHLMRLRADRSVYSVVAHHVRNERVRQALSFHSLLVGGNPFATSAIYTLIHYLERRWGVYFPRGGTGALVQALVRLFQELGGELRLSAPVTAMARSHTRQHVVEFTRGDRVEREQFDVVVSNADLHHTYGELLAGDPAAGRTARRLRRMDWSMSLFVLYFGTDRSYRDEVVHHTILFGPRYRELLDQIFRGPRLPEEFSLYLHAPTCTDPSMAPPGCGSFYVLSPVPHLGVADLDWDRIGPAYAEQILTALESVLPELRKHVVVKHWIDPFHFRDALRSYHGSAFSCAPRLTQSAYFRPHNRDPRIPGLYLVGAGTHPGAGIPGVVNSAKATADLIVADYT